jgi:hypothetical protein
MAAIISPRVVDGNRAAAVRRKIQQVAASAEKTVGLGGCDRDTWHTHPS